ncbi:Methionyl-tRNA formyltransferase [Buchnera aphidicola (Cinara piceae)]|uniref:Methionyl-tRNA formyltransferase n=1 Tax=Buchnera aphidicola (Cinara piceae) TaxID=1660043 RepID=A0A803FUC4_9GAMM|nr:methionyl-tRNA formyltransferase [Buchnera aphidicola]VFP88654.1 Methionyl-tRNA formyltransferase [Buchnera aphidicola (Cinara piceae)]
MSKKILKIIFAGSNDFSLAHLYSLFYSKYVISAIITKPDNIYCKKKNNPFSSIKKFAIKNNIKILQPNDLFEKKFYKSILDIQANILIVSSYGSIIPKKILKLFPLGGINIHASLLPRWKGAAPVQWAILSGDKQTGISVIKMNSNIDSGKIIYTLTCPINSTDTTTTLCAKLIPISLQCMYQSLNIINNPNIKKYYKQDKNLETKAPKIKKRDSRISWSLSVIQIDRLIRAFTPWPCCQFFINGYFIKIKKHSIISFNKKNFYCGEIIKINKKGIQINTKKGILNIEKIQIPGKKTIHISQIIHTNKKLFIKHSILK